MFDTKLRKYDYDKLNSISKKQNTIYYTIMTAFHTFVFMDMCYFFRYRRISLPATLLISSAYYFFFTKVNNIAYKLIVDAKIIKAAREMGQEKHI